MCALKPYKPELCVIMPLEKNKTKNTDNTSRFKYEIS